MLVASPRHVASQGAEVDGEHEQADTPRRILRRRSFVAGAAATAAAVGVGTEAGAVRWSLASRAEAAEAATTPLPPWFRDVPPGHPFHDEIVRMAVEGVVRGYPDQTFRPTLAVSRQAVLAFLHRLSGSPPGPFPDPRLPDVGPDHPFRTAVAWAVDRGIVRLAPGAPLRPDDPVSRQALAAFLHRLEGEPPGPFPDPRLPDVGAGHPFRLPIHWLVRSAITTRYADGTFRPLAAVTRQAAAAFLSRLLDLRQDQAHPFRHGVASGDPLPDGVLLWTRVTPVPEATPGSGLGPPASVVWEVARSPHLTDPVARGTVTTDVGHDHTVKVDVRGLEPSTSYWFRFILDGVPSPVGRTRTAPAADGHPEHLRLGVVSCSDLESGWFGAYRHLAARDDLDVVVHLGDLLYEHGNRQRGAALRRQHEPPHETLTLADYRQRHAQYARDPDLQALRGRHPVVAVLDDHEVANDAWRAGAQNHTADQEGPYEQRRAAAYQAYLEYLPIREARPGAVERRLSFGSLADLHLLDLRRYRDEPVASTTDRAGIADPRRTITGAEQMHWLQEGLAAPGAPQWRLIATSVLIAPLAAPVVEGVAARALAQLAGSRPLAPGNPFNVDQWDGYRADQAALLAHLHAHDLDDVVFLAGDLHGTWASELPVVPADPDAQPPAGAPVAVELAVPSVSSDNVDDIAGWAPRAGSLAVEAAFRATNPHVRHVELDSHGYGVLDLTTARLRMEWWYLSDRHDPAARRVPGQAWEVVAGSRRLARGPDPAA